MAAHECGHAIQHSRGYAPLKIRSAIVPVANFGSAIAWPLILLGLLFNSRSSYLLIQIGILAFSFAVLFQLVTLPVEFNASRRAVQILGESGMLLPDELSMTKKVLRAAALTYVAGAASAILQLLRIILLQEEDGVNKPIEERELILAILLEVTRDKVPGHLALSRVLSKYQYLDKRERAFITRVTEGTLEHMIEIDYIIDQFSKTKTAKMKPVIRIILRSAVYQLKYMDQVPPPQSAMRR